MTPSKLTYKEAVEEIRTYLRENCWAYGRVTCNIDPIVDILSRVVGEEPQGGHAQNCTCHTSVHEPRNCGGGEHSHPYLDPRCAAPAPSESREEMAERLAKRFWEARGIGGTDSKSWSNAERLGWLAVADAVREGK